MPAPVYNKDLSIDLNSKVSHTVKLFNSALKRNLPRYDFYLIDFYKFTSGRNNFSNEIFHCDSVHLGPKAIVEIEKQLKSEENEILKQKNILSENELNTKITDFQNKINDYNLKKQQFTKEVNDQRLNITNNLLKSLNLILSDYASENEISIVLQKKNIIIGKSTLDVTKDVLKIFNENIKTIN